jgi:hypothetical protein
VGHWRWLTQVLTCLALIAGSDAAIAGDLGDASRDSVLISITIAPRLTVREVDQFDDRGPVNRDGNLCIATSPQTGTYHIELVAPVEHRSESNLLGQELVPRPSSEAALRCGTLGSDVQALFSLGQNLQQSLRRPSEALTFLIIPD